MLAFTRMLAGPMDYTPGGFDNVTPAEFEPRNLKPMVMGTRAHQLALYVVFDSPLAMVSDYPEAYRGQKDFQFIEDVPASWDETRVVNGKVGEFVTLARKHGDDWYLGGITNGDARELNLSLEFLGSGEYTAEIYSDAADADVHPKNTAIETTPRRVNASTVLKMNYLLRAAAWRCASRRATNRLDQRVLWHAPNRFLRARLCSEGLPRRGRRKRY